MISSERTKAPIVSGGCCYAISPHRSSITTLRMQVGVRSTGLSLAHSLWLLLSYWSRNLLSRPFFRKLVVSLNFGQLTGFRFLSGFPQGHFIHPNGIGDGFSHCCQAERADRLALRKTMATYRAAICGLAPDMVFPEPFTLLLGSEPRLLFS